MEIKIFETVSQQPNGDRDTCRHPSSSFEVVLVNGDIRKVIFKNDQFKPWWCHIEGTRTQYLNEAEEFARDMAKTLGLKGFKSVNMTKREKEIMDTEAEINRLQLKLAKLKGNKNASEPEDPEREVSE